MNVDLTMKKKPKFKRIDKTIAQLQEGELTFPRQSGRYRGVSVGRDGDGFFVETHRARSGSRESPSKISKRTISSIEATG